ncbi:putative translation initiation factor eIF-2B subunit beta-like [Apostichopus japonicus]|uniref:Translation initiation factor eIF2B subunit beta n=1 Tax=Stichopus japonicus TaxID=307972 RepID=A0A2G8LD78_STIJA|nr:putative translation initiation factor eIF-2B subunit beta-like [Apostichopus japonicus]
MPLTALPSDLAERLDQFIRSLKKGELKGSYDVAHQTLLFLRRLISQSRWSTAKDLRERIRLEGKKLISTQPSESAIGNMVRRVLKIIWEEYVSIISGQGVDSGDTQESLQKMLRADVHVDDFSKPCPNLKGRVIESINELLSELEGSADSIATQALEHIHSSEVIMTMGKSRTVEAFLLNAGKSRKFQVIVVESAPSYQGQELAVNLAKKGNIETTVITDSAIYSPSWLDLKAVCGSHALALAAKHYSVPLIVCAPLFKLSPQFLCSEDQEAFNKFESPQNVVDFYESDIHAKVHIHNPVFDYVPPELVTLYISNIGGNAPSYVYRLLRELYHPDDYEI